MEAKETWSSPLIIRKVYERALQPLGAATLLFREAKATCGQLTRCGGAHILLVRVQKQFALFHEVED